METQDGKKKILHRNLLLPCNFLPIQDTDATLITQVENPSRPMKKSVNKSKQTIEILEANVDEDSDESLSESEEIPPQQTESKRVRQARKIVMVNHHTGFHWSNLYRHR